MGRSRTAEAGAAALDGLGGRGYHRTRAYMSTRQRRFVSDAAWAAPQPAVPPRQSARASLVRELLGQPAGLVGTVVVTLVVLGAIFAPLLASYDPAAQSLLDALLPPSREHLLGTDEFGRDVLSRVIYGARASLEVGLVSVLASSIVGTLIG